MAVLAIEGHPKRGNEVIEILEMLGGKNFSNFNGASNMYYLIGIIDPKILCISKLELDKSSVQFTCFTLEEFLEKFPYKVGDKVWLYYENSTIRTTETITSMRWCSKDDCVLYDVCTCCNLKECAFIPYKEETMEDKLEQITFDIPNGYEFFGINDDNQVVLAKKQPQYPKTFIEVLNFWHPDRQIEDDYQRYYKKDLIEKFQDLLYARDAYWKIAGDWKEKRKEKAIHHVLYSTQLGEVVKATIPNCIGNYLLDFPTEEMRDVFYENFKDLIEQCKELL